MSVFQINLPRIFVVVCSLWVVFASLTSSVSAQALTPPTAPLKVAFVGDVGVQSTSERVMQLIKNEGAQLIVIVGDFDYRDDPQRFFDMVYGKTGGQIPILLVVGNHDVVKWGGGSGYQAKFYGKLADFPEVNCSGDFGVNGTCTYKGVKFLLSGVQTLGSNHDQYLTQQLSTSTNLWNICLWHRNIQSMSVAERRDETHHASYDICKNFGAPIITAHEHSYHRTKTLSSITPPVVAPAWSDPNKLAVGPGLTFVTVTGAGGESMREQMRCRPFAYPYGCPEWAFIYTSNQNAKFGAQFITFGAGSAQNATGYFKNIDGQVVEQFTITNTKSLGANPPPPPPPPPAPVRGDFNGDRAVNVLDYQRLIGALHTTNATYSLNGSDNYIDLYDYNEFLKLL